ncbi:MAG: anaerobic ribonucleoside-triphosphate reductase [Patescibacteria group bacterium]
MSTQNFTANQSSTATGQKTRTRCEVWTRVMGYHRPVQNFNVGKKAEHYSRCHFSEAKTCAAVSK